MLELTALDVDHVAVVRYLAPRDFRFVRFMVARALEPLRAAVVAARRQFILAAFDAPHIARLPSCDLLVVRESAMFLRYGAIMHGVMDCRCGKRRKKCKRT